jgi:Dyp-type peroxidase family
VSLSYHATATLCWQGISNNWQEIDNAKANLVDVLGSDVTFVHELRGEARPGEEAGREHFGYMDGIAQPAVKGFTTNTFPGQQLIDPGHFILGEEGDNSTRPAWAKGGSIMAFRQLQQLVPGKWELLGLQNGWFLSTLAEFKSFVADQAAENGISPDLLGARIIGRWKSGAPVDLAPTEDDPALAADPTRNNNFDFSHPDSYVSFRGD